MNPTNPTPGQAVDIWVKVGYNSQTNRCYLYYTTDGSDPRAVHPGGLQFVPGWQPRGTGAGNDDG